MLKYYISFIPQIFQSLSRWRGMVLLAVTIVVAGVMFFNAEIGKQILDHWDGFNPVWSLLPIGIGALWEFLRLNYERQSSAQSEMSELKEQLHRLKESQQAPDLRFEPRVYQDWLATPQGSRVGSALLAEVKITNKSKHGMMITAEVFYRDDFTKNALRVTGRWTDGPFLGERNEAIRPIILDAGQSRRLGIAVKPQLADMWYALDDASPFEGYCVDKYELVGPVFIEVQLNGNKETVTRHFQLKEENGTPKFDAV